MAFIIHPDYTHTTAERPYRIGAKPVFINEVVVDPYAREEAPVNWHDILTSRNQDDSKLSLIEPLSAELSSLSPEFRKMTEQSPEFTDEIDLLSDWLIVNLANLDDQAPSNKILRTMRQMVNSQPNEVLDAAIWKQFSESKLFPGDNVDIEKANDKELLIAAMRYFLYGKTQQMGSDQLIENTIKILTLVKSYQELPADATV